MRLPASRSQIDGMSFQKSLNAVQISAFLLVFVGGEESDTSTGWDWGEVREAAGEQDLRRLSSDDPALA